MRLAGKTAMITGASRNIGKEVALTFAREGADLVLNTRSSQPELEEVAAQCRELGVNTHVAMGDVTNPDRAQQMVQEGIDALGKIDVLVSTVAIRPHKPILEVSNEEWDMVMRTNLFTDCWVCSGRLPLRWPPTISAPTWSTQAPQIRNAVTRSGTPSFSKWIAVLATMSRAYQWDAKGRCRTSPMLACSSLPTSRPTLPETD